MCHMMPQWHVTEWQEEEEQAIVHRGSSGLNHVVKLHLTESTKELVKVSSVT